MAMMITKFHKLIQSKTVWYIVLGVIIITFVGFFTPTMDTGGDRRQPPAGELFGRRVNMDEFRQAWRNAYLWQILSSGQMIQLTQEISEMLDEEAWIRLAALRKAEKQGVQVTAEETVRQIQFMPVFAGQDGRFSQQQYRAVLRNIGVSSAHVEQLVREQLMFSKLLYRYTQAAWVPPSDILRAFHLYTDLLELDYVVIRQEDLEADVSVSDEQARAFYEQHPQRFAWPERVLVSYVEFPVASFKDQIDLAEEALFEFYTRNTERFRRPSENGEEKDDIRPFEEVREEIVDLLSTREARRLAAIRASEFVAEVAPRQEGVEPDFKGAAEAAGLTVQTRPAFSRQDRLSGIDPTAPFAEAAFRLRDDPLSSFSDAVVGRESAYVLSLERRFESFVPDFDVVQDEVRKAALEYAVRERLVQRAMEVHAAAVEAAFEGRSFRDAVAAFDLESVRTPQFSLTGDELDDPFAYELISLSLDAGEGWVSEPEPVEGGVLIVHVAQRVSLDPEEDLPEWRDELVAGLEQNRARQLVSGWRESVLAEAGFVDLR